MIEVFDGVRSSRDCPDEFIGSSSGDGRVFRSVFCDHIGRYVRLVVPLEYSRGFHPE